MHDSPASETKLKRRDYHANKLKRKEYYFIIDSIQQILFAVDSENDSPASETKPAKEAIDFKELKRVDHILASLQRKVNVILNTGT